MKHLATSIIALVAIAFVAACGTHRAVVAPAATSQPQPNTQAGNTATSQAPTTQPNVAQQMSTTFLNWNTLQASGSVELDGGVSMSSSMQMRMIKGKSIYISIRPFGLVEVAKIMITGDTLIVVDKLHKRYLCENVKLITGGIPADVNTLQDIFLGRPFVLGAGTLSAQNAELFNTSPTANGGHLLTPIKQYKEFSYRFSFDSKQHILSAEVVPAQAVAGNSAYAVNYSNVKCTMAGNVAQNIHIATQLNAKDFTLNLKYSNLSWNGAVKIDTTLPGKKYKRVAGTSLLYMLNNK